MIKLEKNLDPDFYHTFYPKEAEHKEAIIWKALCQDGKEEYSRWLGSKIFEQKSELKEQADKLSSEEINREEYDNWRYHYPEFDTTQRWAKVPSQELSDALVEAFKDHLKDK